MTAAIAAKAAPALSARQTLAFLRAYAADPPRAFLAAHRAVGATFAATIPGHRLVSSIDSRIIDHVLRERPERFGKGRHAEALAPLWGHSTLQLSDSADWTRQRRAVAPFFRSAQTAEVRAATERRVPQLLDEMDRAARDDAPVALYHCMRDVYFRTLCDVWFGAMPDAETDRIAALLRRGTDHAARRMLRLISLPLALPTPANRAYRRVASKLHGILEHLLAHAGDQAPGTMLAALQAASLEGNSAAMTREEARNNLVLFLLAAYEFPSLGWTLQYIGERDEVRARVLAEAVSPPATDTGLPYLECCFQEALRLASPSPMLGRVVSLPSEAAGIELPAGHTLVLALNALHRDPTRWDNPDVYRPERFLAPIPTGAYLPFGAGPRGCIGQALTRLLNRSVVGKFFASFDYTLISAEPPEPHDRLKSYPKGGVLARVHRR